MNQITTPVMPDLAAVDPTALLKDRFDLLANEMAAELQTPKEILAKYGIKQKDFRLLAKTDRFKRAYKTAKTEWASEDGMKALFARKCRMAADDGILDIHQIVKDTKMPPANRIEAHKHLSAMGNLAPSKVAGEEGQAKHTIVINIGKSHGREPLTVEGSVVEQEAE